MMMLMLSRYQRHSISVCEGALAEQEPSRVGSSYTEEAEYTPQHNPSLRSPDDVLSTITRCELPPRR